MSQKKVDKYKNNKYSRNSALKKERAEFVLEMAAWILIAVLLVGWIGYSAYAKIQAMGSRDVLKHPGDFYIQDKYNAIKNGSAIKQPRFDLYVFYGYRIITL